MEGGPRDLAVARGKRYLKLCGVPPATDAELTRMLDASASHNGSAPLEPVLTLLFDHLDCRRTQVPPATPPLHRSSMSYGPKR